MMELNTIKDYLLENIDTLKDVVSECNSWNGSLDAYSYWYNDEETLSMFFDGQGYMYVLERAFYGDYNPNDEYFTFNGYGNLVSLDDMDLEEMLRDGINDIVDALIDNYDNIYLYDSELEDMVNEYMENEEE